MRLAPQARLPPHYRVALKSSKLPSKKAWQALPSSLARFAGARSVPRVEEASAFDDAPRRLTSCSSVVVAFSRGVWISSVNQRLGCTILLRVRDTFQALEMQHTDNRPQPEVASLKQGPVPYPGAAQAFQDLWTASRSIWEPVLAVFSFTRTSLGARGRLVGILGRGSGPRIRCSGGAGGASYPCPDLKHPISNRLDEWIIVG